MPETIKLQIRLSPELLERFRTKAALQFKGRKGYISKAAAEAIAFWVESTDQKGGN